MKVQTYGNSVNILMFTQPMVAVPIELANTSVVAGTEGKKIAKAGTPVYGSLKARETPFTVTGAEGATPAAVLLHDVDVTDGTANTQAVIHGFINMNKLDATTAALITGGVETALPMISFLK